MINKKAAIMTYSQFCMQEISCLTELFKFNDKDITVFASKINPIKSEDGFTILPDKTFSQFERQKYDCLILPGIWDYRNALQDDANIEFLKQFKDDSKIIIGSISSSPILLAKAEVLDMHMFCAGLYEEVIDKYTFIPRKNLVRKHICEDGNLITAIGFAYREFAIAVMRKLGFQCGDGEFKGVIKENYTEEELTYHTTLRLEDL